MEHLLCEHIGGFELFELKGFEKLASASFNDYMALSQTINHLSSLPIDDLVEIAEQMKCLEQGIIHPILQNFLELNNVRVLHCDKSLKNALKQISIEQKSSPNILRGVKFNLKKITKKPMNKQLALGVSHILSREAIKYNMEREDNVVVCTGYEIEHLEADVLGQKEKISKLLDWNFPQLGKVLKEDTETFFKVLNGEIDQLDSSVIPDNMKPIIKEMLADVKNEDIDNLKSTVELINNKKRLLAELENYLMKKMRILAPNLIQILGDRLTFKLIHKAGGLMNLSLYPSSTLQLLGAEKALFRSLKMKSHTPKHGLLYQLDYLKENRGRMSRYIATKCSLAARIDCFSEDRTDEFGKELRRLIEKKIKSYKSHATVETSAELLQRVQDKLNSDEKNLKKSNPVQIDDISVEKRKRNDSSGSKKSKISNK